MAILISKTHKVVEPKSNSFFNTFTKNESEIVVRFENFSRQRKYFAFAVLETDANGNLLDPETAQEELIACLTKNLPIDALKLLVKQMRSIEKEIRRYKDSTPSPMDECIPPAHV